MKKPASAGFFSLIPTVTMPVVDFGVVVANHTRLLFEGKWSDELSSLVCRRHKVKFIKLALLLHLPCRPRCLLVQDNTYN